MSAVSLPEPVAVDSKRLPGRQPTSAARAPVAYPARRLASGADSRPSCCTGRVPWSGEQRQGELQDSIRYRYMRVLQQKQDGRSCVSVRFIPLPADGPFRCAECGASSGSLAEHRKHMRIHASTTTHYNYSCPYCERKFVTAGIYRRHLATHGQQQEQGGPRGPEQRCGDCQTASTTTPLRRLQAPYERPRRHTCSTCLMSFRTAAYLVAHERVHSGKLCFSCSCGKVYQRRCYLDAHLAANMAYACARPGCSFRCRRREQLDEHRLQCAAPHSAPHSAPRRPRDGGAARVVDVSDDAKEADIVVLHEAVEVRSTVMKSKSGGGVSHGDPRPRDHPVPPAPAQATAPAGGGGLAAHPGPGPPGLAPGLRLIHLVAVRGPAAQGQEVPAILVPVTRPGLVRGGADTARLPAAAVRIDGVSRTAPRLRRLLPAPPRPRGPAALVPDTARRPEHPAAPEDGVQLTEATTPPHHHDEEFIDIETFAAMYARRICKQAVAQ